MGGCCEKAGLDGWCREHRRAAGEGRMTYNPANYLGEHISGGVFTPDGTGGGTLAWVEEGPYGRPVLREIRKQSGST